MPRQSRASAARRGSVARPRAGLRRLSPGSGLEAPDRFSGAHRAGFRLYWRWRSRARGGPPDDRAGLDDGDGVQGRGEKAIEPYKEQAIAARMSYPTSRLPPQNDHLMAKNGVLCLAPSHRSEWREKDGEEQPDQRDHQPTSLLDSSAQTSRMRLSAGTRGLLRLDDRGKVAPYPSVPEEARS